MSSICLIRSGHLGDVIMTEPIGRFFQSQFDEVYLATDFIQAKLLIGDSYTDFIKFNELESCTIKFDRQIILNYELSPQSNYIEGYANSANIILEDNIPKVKADWQNILNEDYVLIAPHTSHWVYSMRNWGEENFMNLKSRIEREYNIRVVNLNKEYSFTEMLSLIRHCKMLIGNDSAPGIIAQCFNVKSAIIFGATHPKHVFFNKNAIAIFRDIDCIGCRHISRHTEIECGSPFCLSKLTVENVISSISPMLKTILQQ
jgi:ADP-heptose:LPS heptosyltransferase